MSHRKICKPCNHSNAIDARASSAEVTLLGSNWGDSVEDRADTQEGPLLEASEGCEAVTEANEPQAR